MPTIIFTVTNDLTYDQRMQRICTSIANAGYDALLVGRRLPNSKPLAKFPFNQKRIYCIFKKGMGFYVEYNIRLFFFLLFAKCDAFCAIDLDTILPCYFVSVIKRKKRVYDAHELFTEQKEIVTRKLIHRVWTSVEQFAVPRYIYGYTVNQFIKEEFYRRYKADYGIVRNLPVKKAKSTTEKFSTKTIIYQGAVNEGRSFETLIPAMKMVDAQLMICGVGNFLEQTKALVKTHKLEDKVIFKGAVAPAELFLLTQQSHIGVMLFEPTGLNQYYSLANRFFDYMMAGIPQLCVNYPEYAVIIKEHPFAYLINDTSVNSIANGLNNLLVDHVLYSQLSENAIAASSILNWNEEEKTLVKYWQKVLGTGI